MYGCVCVSSDFGAGSSNVIEATAEINKITDSIFVVLSFIIYCNRIGENCIMGKGEHTMQLANHGIKIAFFFFVYSYCCWFAFFTRKWKSLIEIAINSPNPMKLHRSK